MQYFLHDGQEQYGPFTFDEVYSNSLLTSKTLESHDRMTDWTKANQDSDRRNSIDYKIVSIKSAALEL